MLRVRDDDAEAFRELVTRYQSRLVRILESWLGNRDSAEDLAQEVFMRVYRSRANYQPTAKFSTWFFRIATNAARNAIRDRSRRKEYQVSGAPANDGQPPSLSEMAFAKSGLLPQRSLENLEKADIVRLAINELNDRQRMATILSKFEGMSYQEIGESMDLSEKAVKSLLCRARARLREILIPYLDEGRLPNQTTPRDEG